MSPEARTAAEGRFLVAALYRFTALSAPETLVERLRAAAPSGVVGSLLIAEEGVNGTLAGPERALRTFLDRLRGAAPGLARLSWKESWSDGAPFGRLKIRLKREIVTMGAPGLVAPDRVGAYVPPEDWNRAIAEPGVAVIDVRNAYETAIGRFEGAIDPGTDSFRDFPAWAARSPALADKPPVAMYCTGGVRCEKASAWLRAQGFERVLQLEGGILRYLEVTPPERSLWRGGCFVFDERVSVGHDLRADGHALCRGCRRPLTPADQAGPDFAPGVSCRWCAADIAPDQRDRRRERQRQIALAEARGAAHLGPSSVRRAAEDPGA